MIPLPDPRLDTVAGMLGSDKILPATVTLRRHRRHRTRHQRGRGPGNEFLANIREADAISGGARVRGRRRRARRRKGQSGQRHRDDPHRADPRRPPDPREGRAPSREGGAHEQGQGRARQRRCRAEGPRGRSHAVCRPAGRRGRPYGGEGAGSAHDQAVHLRLRPRRGPARRRRAAGLLRELAGPGHSVFLDAKLEMDLMDMEPRRGARAAADFGAEESGLDRLRRRASARAGCRPI